MAAAVLQFLLAALPDSSRWREPAKYFCHRYGGEIMSIPFGMMWLLPPVNYRRYDHLSCCSEQVHTLFSPLSVVSFSCRAFKHYRHNPFRTPSFALPCVNCEACVIQAQTAYGRAWNQSWCICVPRPCGSVSACSDDRHKEDGSISTLLVMDTGRHVQSSWVKSPLRTEWVGSVLDGATR